MSMEKSLLLPEAVQPAYAHALPFRVIFEEYRQRRPDDLLYVAGEVFAQQPPIADPVQGRARTELRLRQLLEEQESKYRHLQEATADIASGAFFQPLDPLIEACSMADRPLKQILHKLNGHALCLSGGGIRSASFNLGLLEGLARIRNAGDAPTLMLRLDYLSTVSGGGYIASWFSGWVMRRWTMHLRSDLNAPPANAYREVLDALAGKAPGTGGDPDPQQTRHLRSYTSFLAPELGASFDTAALAAIVLRNLTVNWTLLLPLLFAVISATLLIDIALQNLEAHLPNASFKFALDATLVLLFLGAAGSAAFGLPSHRRRVAPLNDIASRFLRAWQRIFLARVAIGTIQRLNGVVTAVLSGPISPHKNGMHVAVSEVSDNTFDGKFLIASVNGNTITWSDERPAANAVGGYLQLPLPLMSRKPIRLFVACVLAGSLLVSVAQGIPKTSWFDEVWPNGVVALIDYLVLGAYICLVDLNRRRLLSMEPNAAAAHPAAAAGTAANLAAHIHTLRRAAGAVAAAVAAAAATTGLLYLMRSFLYAFLWNHSHHDWLDHKVTTNRLFVVLALPCVLTILMLTATLFCALLGTFEQEEDREWWSRAGAVFLSFSVCWLGLQLIVLYGMDLSLSLNRALGLLGLGLGAGASALGSSGATSAGPRPIKSSQLTAVGKFLIKYNLLLPAVGGAALGLIAIGAVYLEEQLRTLLIQSSFSALCSHASPDAAVAACLRAQLDDHWLSALIMFLAFASLTVVLNLAVDMNLFTLQGMYRMRLMRAFLGASNPFRRPDPFTRFDPRDTPHLCELVSAPGTPLHVINAALNLTGTKDSALRQRMAENFTLTPQTTGGWRVGYARSSQFGGGPRGLTLATAMSISGSAFNPNMGYHTSPLLSLLMTFFNLRLGVWLPNPKWPSLKAFAQQSNKRSANPLTLADEEKAKRDTSEYALKHIRRTGPTFSLVTLIGEALGRTDDGNKWIELTDGGHFENLGLYEMVLRRCKCIIVSDAGADPDCQFEDLGNAIRKIKIDLGIPIEFCNKDDKPNLGMGPHINPANSYCAVARIQYRCVDAVRGMNDQQLDALDGYLIYIKTALTGREPGDVLQYALTHKDFPNESTANQFFNEAQFESYRRLGSFILEEIVKPHPPANQDEPRPYDASFNDLRIAAQDYWHSIPKRQPSNPA